MTTKKVKAFLPLIFFVIMALIYSPAFAEEHRTPQIAVEKSTDGRLQYAKDLLSFIKRIDNQISSLSPSQEEWLGKEIEGYKKTNNSMRYFEIRKTKEFNIDAVKSRLTAMIYSLNSIIKEPSLNKELYSWSVIADNLMDFELWSCLHILIEDFKVVDIKLFYSDSTKKTNLYLFYINNGVIPAKQIIRNIIEP
jgi:hypothetical protein